MLHVVVSLKSGTTVEVPFGDFDLWEATEFEDHFGQSVAVLGRYGDIAERRIAWAAANPEPGKRASAAARAAWEAKAREFEDQLRDAQPPQKYMLYMIWLRASEADAVAVPKDFRSFLRATVRIEYVERADHTSNGHAGEATEGEDADPTSPVAQQPA